MKMYNPNREERAFLYQEAQDLEPLMKDLGSLSVMVEQLNAPTAKRRFRVTFMVAPESVAMRVQATHTNIYSATILAKAETLRQLNTIVNALPRSAPHEPFGGRMPSQLLH